MLGRKNWAMRKEEFRKNLFFFPFLKLFELGFVIYVNGIQNLIIGNSDSYFSWYLILDCGKKFENTSCLARKPLCFLTPVMGAFIFPIVYFDHRWMPSLQALRKEIREDQEEMSQNWMTYDWLVSIFFFSK